MSGMEDLLLGGDSSSDDESNAASSGNVVAAAAAAAAAAPAPSPAAPAPAGPRGGGKADAMKERLKSLYSASKSSAPSGGAASRPVQPPAQQPPQRPSYPPPQQNRPSSQAMPPPQRQAPSHPQQQQQQQYPPQVQQPSQHGQASSSTRAPPDPFAPTPLAQITQRSTQHRASHQQQQQQQPGLGTSVPRGGVGDANSLTIGAGTQMSASGRTMTDQEREVLLRRQKEKFLMFTRVLVKYLEQKDKNLHLKAKAVIKDCADRNKRGERGYESVTMAMQRRLKDLVGETYWKKAHEFLLLMHQKRKAQQQAQMSGSSGGGGSGSTGTGGIGGASFSSRPSVQARQQLTDEQKRDMYNEQKRRQAAMAAAQNSTSTADNQGTPSLDKLRQEVHQKREQIAMQGTDPQAGVPQFTPAAGKGAGAAASPAQPSATTKGKKVTRRKSGDSSKGTSRRTTPSSKQGTTTGAPPAAAVPVQVVTAMQPRPVIVEPPREYEELMQLIDHAVDYDWPSIGQLLGDKNDLNISEEERQLLYGDASPMPANVMTATANAAEGTQTSEDPEQATDKAKPVTLSQPGWGQKNVVSVRAAWAKIRLREKLKRESNASNSAPAVAGGLLTLPIPNEDSTAAIPKPTTIAEGPWVNEETAEQDEALALLSEASQIYLKGVLEKAIHCSRQRQNLDGIRLWHQHYASIEEEPKPAPRGPDGREETEEEKAKREEERQKRMKQNKPPLLLRLGCDVSRQVAQAQGNAALTVKRMEEALERQTDIPSRLRDLSPSAGLAEATSMNDLAMRPLLKEGAKKADYDAKRSFEIYGGKESKDPPFGRVPKQAKLLVDDFIMGSKLSQDGTYTKANDASCFLSF